MSRFERKIGSMPVIHLTFDDPAWPELRDRELVRYQDPISVTALPHGMESGGTSVALRLDLPDGQIVIVETSLAILAAVVRGIMARYPDPPGVGMNAP